MSLKIEQSKKYMEEAELTLESAEAIFEKAKEEDKDLWANVVKSCYDAIEQAISSAISAKEEIIPIRHPDKIIVLSHRLAKIKTIFTNIRDTLSIQKKILGLL